MAVTERFSEQIKKMQGGRSGLVIASLITQERTQKLDLLIHLITNLKQSLIICGPEGIGKTTLLTIFQTRTATVWPIVYLSASELLRFEKIQEHLLRGLTPSEGGNVTQNLNTILRGLEKLNRRVVLIIDEAGFLAPGLMTTLTQYATTYPALRLVFALSDDEVAAKRTADSAIDTCHFIEIPALSESQCGEFLQHLSERLDASEVMADMADGVAQVNKIPKASPALNEQIFKKTKGIPGRITEALPSLSPANKPRRLAWWYVLAGAGTLLIGLVIANHSSTPDHPITGSMVQPETVATASLSIPGQTPPTPTPEPTESEIIAAKQAAKPLIPETLAKPDLYKGYTRAREGNSLDEFKSDTQKALVKDGTEQQADLKIMPAESTDAPAAGVGSPMPAVPSGLAEADIVIADDKAGVKELAPAKPINKADKSISKIPPSLSATPKSSQPPVKLLAENKSAENAKLLKLKELEAKKLADQQAALLLAKKQKAEMLEKTKLKQKAIAEREALKIAESSQQKIVLPENAEPKFAETAKTEAVKDKAKADVLVKPKSPTIIEAKPINLATVKSKPQTVVETKTPEPKLADSTKTEPAKDKAKADSLVKPKNPVIIEAKPVDLAAIKTKSQIAVEAKTPEPTAEKSTGNSRVTLQLMSFTQQSLVDAFMRNHSALGAGLRVITINNGGSAKYVVVYGAFDSNAQANAAKQKLPAEFRQSAWPRKM